MKKAIIHSVVIGSLIAMVAGCGSSTTSGQGSGSGSTNLTFGHWGDSLEKQSIRNLLDSFSKQNPTIHVNQLYVPNASDYITKMNTLASSNTLPDVSYFSEPDVGTWSENGKFVDQSNLYDSSSKMDYLKFHFKGKLAGVSVANEVFVLYYNKDVFDQAHVEYPPASADKAWTWQQFIDVAQRLTVDQNGKHPTEPGFDPNNIKTYGVNIPTWEYIPFLYSNGGGLVSQDLKQILIGSQASIEALQSIADLIYKYHVMPKPSQLSTVPTIDTALLTKRVAMNIDGQWDMQVLGKAEQDNSLKLGIGVLPKFKKAVTSAVGTPIVIFNTNKSKVNLEADKKLLTYTMDPQNSLPLIQSGLWMPNDKKWYTDPDLLKKWIDNPVHPKEYKTAVVDYALNNVVQYPEYFWDELNVANQVINPALDELWTGKKSAEDVVKNEIIPKLKQVLKGKYEYVTN